MPIGCRLIEVTRSTGHSCRQLSLYFLRHWQTDVPHSVYQQGSVYINGESLGDVQDWYARRIGYVLQLAVPYYEELTVRQNVFFAAHMRLPKRTSHSKKLERVEQILEEVSSDSFVASESRDSIQLCAFRSVKLYGITKNPFHSLQYTHHQNHLYLKGSLRVSL